MPKRELNNPDSKPSSVPSTRSGLRSAFPGVPLVSTVALFGPATGDNVRSAELATGCWPEPPYAPRRRRLSMKLGRCARTDGCSLATHDRLAFGYVTQLAWLPNALLLSTRIATVANSRSFSEPSSWP